MEYITLFPQLEFIRVQDYDYSVTGVLWVTLAKEAALGPLVVPSSPTQLQLPCPRMVPAHNLCSKPCRKHLPTFTCPSYRKKLHSPPSPQASPCIAGCFAWNGKNNLNNVPLPKLSVVNEEGTLMLVLVLISAETTDTSISKLNILIVR